jgi:hypothetical protein
MLSWKGTEDISLSRFPNSNSCNHHVLFFTVISTYETPNSECSGLPSTFKAFLKYPCGADNLSGSTEYFACPDKGT